MLHCQPDAGDIGPHRAFKLFDGQRFDRLYDPLCSGIGDEYVEAAKAVATLVAGSQNKYCYQISYFTQGFANHSSIYADWQQAV